MIALALLALGLAACSSAPAGASPSAAGTGAAQTPAAATQSPAGESPSPSVASIKDMDICALISKAEIEKTTGFKVGDGKRLDLQTETAGCQWDGTASGSIQFVTFSVHAFSEDAWFPPDADDPDGEMVTTVGDDAYRKEIGLSDTAGDLVVKSGGLILNITLFNDLRPYKQLHPLQEEFAKMLISRL